MSFTIALADYHWIIEQAEKECPPEHKPPGKKGRQKKSKARNLLERFITFESEILPFMKDPMVPFTNNNAENPIRMSKVHQKVSGCFRSFDGAEIFSLIRAWCEIF
jgi:transposase